MRQATDGQPEGKVVTGIQCQRYKLYPTIPIARRGDAARMSVKTLFSADTSQINKSPKATARCIIAKSDYRWMRPASASGKCDPAVLA
jgi:hypothetical protein